MVAGLKNIFTITATAVVASVISTSAVADTNVIPNLSVSLTSSDTGTTEFNPADFGNEWQNANGTFGFSGSKNSANNWNLGWSMVVNPDPFVIANFVVTNNTAATQTYTIQVLLPYTADGPFCIGGSVTGSLTDLNGNGAKLESLPGGSVYGAIIDNTVVQTLLDSPFSVMAGNFQSAVVGPADFGTPIPSLPYVPNITTNIGINLTFTLSAGDAASFTSIFVVEPGCIPAPGALAMLGIAGLLGGRRRRS